MKKINWWRTKLNIEEQKSLLRAFKKKDFTSGQSNIDLEKNLNKIFKTKYCITCNSGTSAIIMSLLAIGIKPGDEVIVPNFTWIATANAAAILGAKVKLVDSKKNNPTLDENKIEKLINKRTKAIITVNFHGRTCDYKKILSLGKKYNLSIIEDNCKGISGKNKKKNLGTFGLIGCHSLGMISLLPAGFGGFVVTNKKYLANKLRIIRDNGVYRKKSNEKLLYLGSNFKLSGLLASMANSQIKKIQTKIKILKKIYNLYLNNIQNLKVKILKIDIKNGEVPLCIDLFCRERDKLEKYLDYKGIKISKFHTNISESSLVNYKNKKSKFKNSYSFSKYGFMPPCGPGQKTSNIKKVIKVINEWKG